MTPNAAPPMWKLRRIIRTVVLVVVVVVPSVISSWAGTISNPRTAAREFSYTLQSRTAVASLIWGEANPKVSGFEGSNLALRIPMPPSQFDLTSSSLSPSSAIGELDLRMLNLAGHSRGQMTLGVQSGPNPDCHSVPEPASVLLLGASLVALAAKRLVRV